MGRVKIKKKDARIDMTAMSDVTVLLLTFFMLTSTFLQKEPVTVITPSSVSEEKVPVENLFSILVDPEGRVFLSVSGSIDSTYRTELVRADLLKNAAAEYNKLHPSNPVSFTKKQIETFSKISSFGLPMRQMGQWLDMSQEDRDNAVNPEKNKKAGIPIDMNENPETPNEFQMWVRAAYNSMDPGLQEGLVKGKGIAIKADQTTPYSVVQVVMDNLQTMKFNKFRLMTALKKEE